MIFDRLDRLSMYRTLSPSIAAAIDWLLRTPDLNALPLGKVEIVGTDVFAIVQTYTTKAAESAKWETHRKYIDIQVMTEGAERMDVADVETMRDATAYDETKDATFYGAPTGGYQPIEVAAGQFAIFFPHDCHRPTVAVGAPAAIRKVVVKVAV